MKPSSITKVIMVGFSVPGPSREAEDKLVSSSNEFLGGEDTSLSKS